MKSPTQRMFVALLPPLEWIHWISRLQRHLSDAPLPRDAIRWMRRDQLHVTLKFMPSVETGLLPDVREAITRASEAVSTLRLETGSWEHRPRLVWLTLSGELEKALRLRNAIDTEMEQLGFPPEERSFLPHITLGRIRPGTLRKVFAAIPPFPDPPPDPWHMDTVVLMRSQLQPDGAVYSEDFRTALGGC